MKFKSISLKEKKFFEDYFKKYLPKISEFTFTNLFVWGKQRNQTYTIIDKHILVSFIKDKKNKFFQPIGKNPEKIIKKILKKNKNAVFERVEKKIADKFLEDYRVSEQRDMFDYVYKIKDLVELEGGDYLEIRNRIRQCKKRDPEICVLTNKSKELFKKMQENWCKKRKCEENPGLEHEHTAVIEALNNYSNLDVFGICIKINNKIQGFAIGEKLNDNTFVEHFEKGNTNYTGIYQFLLNEFVKSIPEKYKYLNREQDLGIEGIRKSKMRYNPDHFIKKYRIENET